MEKVYAFAFPRARRKVLAGKGVTGTRPWIEPSKGKVRGGRLWIVGVDGIKAAVMARLTRGSSFRFSADLTPAWFEQLASERAIVRYNRGQTVRRFERIPGRRAEALDCVVYAVAVKQILHGNWSAREEQLRHPETVQAVARPRTIPSAFMER
jgi:phage terminase large subunit GpA-like protein